MPVVDVICTLCFIVGLLLHSAGVGRTGSFIAIDAMMQRLKEEDDLDIYNFVTQMRTKRTYMVQNLVRRQTMLMFPSLSRSVVVVVVGSLADSPYFIILCGAD